MPIPIAELQKAAEPLTVRILRFLQGHTEEAFSVLEIIESVEEIPANEIPALVLAQKKASGQSALLESYKRALHDLEFDTLSGCPVLSAEHGGTWYFGIDPKRKTG